jgi:amino acid transporter
MIESAWIIGLPLIALLIVAIGIFTVWRTVKEKRSGFALKDERTTRIQGRAANVAFFLGTWYLILLNFYNLYRIMFLGLEELESMPVINSAVILMGVSYIALMAYFGRREDI